MKRKKKTLILLLTLVVLLGGGAATYVGAKLVMRRRVAEWKQEGIAAAKARNHERASDLLLRYLQRRAWDTEALGYYIKSRESVELPNGQHLAETIGALKLLLQEEPDRLEDRRHLLDLYVKVNRLPEALETADLILKKQRTDAVTLGLKTEVLMRMRRDREALAVAEDWKSNAPQDLKAHITHLTLRGRLEQSPEAVVADVEKLQKEKPHDPKLQLLLGIAHGYAGDNEEEVAEASKWLTMAGSHDGLSDDFIETLVAQFDRFGKPEEGVAMLEDLVNRGSSAKSRHLLGRRLWERGQWARVVELLKDINPADVSADPTLLAFKAIAHANLGQKAEAEPCRAALASRNQAAARAWTLILRRVIDAAVLDEKQVVADCRAALILEPQNGYLDYYLGDANARLGETDLAIEAWQRVVSQNGSWHVPALRLVEALLQKGQAEQAMRLAATAARRSPTNAASIITLARAWAADVETGGAAKADELLKLVTEVQRQLPGEDQTLLIQIQLLGQKGQKAEATELARSAMARTPAPAQQLFLSLAGVSRKLGLQLEEECFSRSEQAHGLTPELGYARAVDQLIDGHGEDGLKLLDESAKRGKGDPVAWQLARAKYLDISNNREAAAAWRTLGDAHPNSLEVQQAIVSARALRGDWDSLQRTIDRLRTLTGDRGLAWRLAQARLMVESPRTDADYTQGSVLLNEIIKEYPMLAEPRVLLARALVRMKRVDGAIDHLSHAAKLEPGSVPIALQLSALLQSRGDFERVREELDRVAPRMKSPAERRNAALLLAQQGSEGGAIELLESQNANGQKQDDLLLATLYRKNGELDKAEAVVRKLLEAPDAASVEFAVSLFTSQGRRSDAEQALARLDAAKLEPGINQLLWGAYRVQIGDLKQAIEHFRKAVQEAPTNAAARRNLAVFQMASGQVDEALATVDEAAKSLPEDQAFTTLKQQSKLLREAAADDGLRPVVLAVMREPSRGEAGIELMNTVLEGRRTNDMERLASRLQQLVERHVTFLPARMQLVQCYWAMGRQNDAMAAAQQAMKTFSSDPAPAKLVVQLSATRARWQDVLTAAQAWKKRAPAEARAAEVAIARAEVGLGQMEAAVNRLQPHLAAVQADPDKHPELLMVYSIALANAGKGQDATNLLGPLAATAPAWRTRWIQVAGELRDQKQAVEWLNRVEPIIPADALAEQVILAEAYDRLGYDRSGKAANPELVRKASEMLARAAAHPKATAITFLAAAGQAERAGDVEAAEGFYRRALALNDNLLPAHNNLAMLIARRTGGNLTEAAAHAAAAVKLQPRQATLHDTLAFVQSKAGDPKAAAASMTTAVSLEPEIVKWRVRLAQYLLQGGQVAEAAEAVGAIDARRLDLRDQPQELRRQLDEIRKQVRGNRSTAAAR